MTTPVVIYIHYTCILGTIWGPDAIGVKIGVRRAMNRHRRTPMSIPRRG